MRKFNRKILILMSDPHAGFRLGLTNPETELYNDDGERVRRPEMNPGNYYLWNDIYKWALDEIKAFAKKDEVILLSLGDMTHGIKYIGDQKSLEMSDEVFIAEANLDYAIRKFPNLIAVFNAIGNNAHNWGEGASEKLITRLIQNSHPKLRMKVLYHGLLRIAKNYAIDFAHVGPGTGIRNWTKGNVARLYLKSLMQDEIDHDKMPPELVLRGHFHEYIREKQIIVKPKRDYESEIIIVPSMCLVSTYATQATKSPSRVENGLIVKEIINGKEHQTLKFTKILDKRTMEELL